MKTVAVLKPQHGLAKAEGLNCNVDPLVYGIRLPCINVTTHVFECFVISIHVVWVMSRAGLETAHLVAKESILELVVLIEMEEEEL